MYTLTHSNVIEYLHIEVTSPMEEKTEAYIGRYVRSLDRYSLSLFVQFCTSSSPTEPGSSVKVYKQFKTACDGVLHSPTMWSMDDGENETFD